MKILSDQLSEKVFTVLKDETRLAIYICLSVYPNLTVKQLGLYLHKGKTTINHHLKVLHEADIVTWKEKEEDKKKLKTRYFSLNNELLKDLYKFPPFDINEELKEEKKVKTLKTQVTAQSSVITNLLNWMTKYIEELNFDLILEDKKPTFFIKRINLTPETLKNYQEREKTIIEDLKNTSDFTSTTHIGTHILIPIKDILEWRKSLKQRKE